MTRMAKYMTLNLSSNVMNVDVNFQSILYYVLITCQTGHAVSEI